MNNLKTYIHRPCRCCTVANDNKHAKRILRADKRTAKRREFKAFSRLINMETA